MAMLLNARGLSKHYGDLLAVDDFSMQLAPGETVGLLGPNGAGKTTTIAMLTGLLRPDSGSLTIGGRPGNHPEVKKKIGLAPQQLSLYQELTAEENLKFFGGLFGLSGKQLSERVRQMLKLAQLEDRRNHKVATYSGGMKRRLNIAAALVHQPELLMLDEPTVGVDPQSRNHILDWIRDLASAGLTVLYTTHYMEEAEKLCDRIVIMDQGKILAEGSNPSLLEQFTDGPTIQFVCDPKIAAQLQIDFPNLQTSPDSNGRTRVQLQTRDVLSVLGNWKEKGLGIADLTITQPQLEQVFLGLTGRSLRD